MTKSSGPLPLSDIHTSEVKLLWTLPKLGWQSVVKLLMYTKLTADIDSHHYRVEDQVACELHALGNNSA